MGERISPLTIPCGCDDDTCGAKITVPPSLVRQVQTDEGLLVVIPGHAKRRCVRNFGRIIKGKSCRTYKVIRLTEPVQVRPTRDFHRPFQSVLSPDDPNIDSRGGSKAPERYYSRPSVHSYRPPRS